MLSADSRKVVTVSLKAKGAYCDGEMTFKLEVGDHAWWSTFSHMAEVILVFLRQYKAAKRNGVPGTMFDCTDPSVEFTDAMGRKWERTLDKMIKAFELIVLDNNDLPCPAIVEMREQDIEDGLLEFAIHFRSLWD